MYKTKGISRKLALSLKSWKKKASVKTKDGPREENLYCVMLHYPNGKMYFEEFFESELELVQH